jgi:hypothetical protein
MLVAPAALMLMGLPSGSKAKLFGAVISEPDVVHVDWSSSAMKASLNCDPTNSGNSSDRNLKSMVRQFAVAGTFRSILRTVTSKAVLPRPWSVPPSSAPLLGALFASSASVASPEVRIA